MNVVLISIGSNENRETNLLLCHQLLDVNFDSIIYSQTSITSPYGTNYKRDFINQLAVIHTLKNKYDVISSLKSIETKMGRKPDDKQNGIVIVDVDIVIWNNEILKPEDISRTYIKNLIPTLPSQSYDKFITL